MKSNDKLNPVFLPHPVLEINTQANVVFKGRVRMLFIPATQTWYTNRQ